MTLMPERTPAQLQLDFDHFLLGSPQSSRIFYCKPSSFSLSPQRQKQLGANPRVNSWHPGRTRVYHLDALPTEKLGFYILKKVQH